MSTSKKMYESKLAAAGKLLGAPLTIGSAAYAAGKAYKDLKGYPTGERLAGAAAAAVTDADVVQPMIDLGKAAYSTTKNHVLRKNDIATMRGGTTVESKSLESSMSESGGPSTRRSANRTPTLSDLQRDKTSSIVSDYFSKGVVAGRVETDPEFARQYDAYLQSPIFRDKLERDAEERRRNPPIPYEPPMSESSIKDRILNIIAEKLEALKEHLMLEANRNVIKQGRAKIIKARVRGGKIQRRKKLSAVKGYTIRGGKLVRMSPSEKRKRKMGARRGKLKRRAKMARALMKRKRSLRKRAAIGLK